MKIKRHQNPGTNFNLVKKEKKIGIEQISRGKHFIGITNNVFSVVI